MHKDITVVQVPWGALTEDQKKLDMEIQDIWARQALGNDFYYYPWDEDKAAEYPTIAAYIKANQLEGKVLLHYSW